MKIINSIDILIKLINKNPNNIFLKNLYKKEMKQVFTPENISFLFSNNLSDF